MKYKLLPVTCGNTKKQGLNYGNGALMNLPHIGISENSIIILMNAPTFRIVTQKVLSYAIYSSTAVACTHEGKLKSEEMRRGCFTISSLGGIGGTHFTPIINLLEAAIPANTGDAPPVESAAMTGLRSATAGKIKSHVTCGNTEKQGR